jgi:lipopolysaccharide export LptBFGC system permease protein LptF
VQIIDRYIVARFLGNFMLLFLLLFLFAGGIDIILNLDEFVRAGNEQAGEDGSLLKRIVAVVGLMIDFQGPRLFLFYAYMHGMVAVGAMGFTLAQMYRHKELVAILASGVSLHRLAMPFLAATCATSVVQLLNQEFVLYRVAPLVLRRHAAIGQESISGFPVSFVHDGQGMLLQAASFDPGPRKLGWPTFLERDDIGRTIRHISAESALWNTDRRGWDLAEGRVYMLGDTSGSGNALNGDAATSWRPIDFIASTLSPRALTIKRYSQFATMLSLRQIEEMLKSPRVVDTDALLRYRYARFSSILVNLLVMALALPFFLLREPANLMRQSALCAGTALPTLFGSTVGMMVQIPGFKPAFSVFLPVIVLIPVAFAAWTDRFLKT